MIGVFIAFSIYLIRLDNIIRNKFEGQRWDIPAKVFARPLEIYANAPNHSGKLHSGTEATGL